MCLGERISYLIHSPSEVERDRLVTFFHLFLDMVTAVLTILSDIQCILLCLVAYIELYLIEICDSLDQLGTSVESFFKPPKLTDSG